MAGLIRLDAELSIRLRRAEQPGPLRTVAVFLAHSGDSWFWLLGLGVIWLVGSAYWRQRVQVFAAGIILTAVLVMVTKVIVRRRRPEGEWGSFYRATDPHSFPSGHAARAFMLAVIGWGLGPLWLGVVLTVWAPLVGLARVAMGVHYLSDVLAGVLFGLVMGVLVLGVF